MSFSSISDLVETIQAMTISPLRNLAREFGITPSTKKREQLEKEILGVFDGSIIPQAPSKRGRKPLNIGSPTDIGSDINAKISSPEPIIADNCNNSSAEDIQFCDNANNICNAKQEEQNDIIARGILEIMPEGYGFLRTNNFSVTPNKDVYVPATQIKRFGLCTGDEIECKARLFNERSAPSVIYIFKINGDSCENIIRRPAFDSLVPCHPTERIALETTKTEFALRAIDLVAPIGKGQRGLIVAPPKAGKTILLKKIALAVRQNHPGIHLTILLIDERPEEVTDFKESVDCDVVYSTFDQSPMHHIRIADMVIRNAKRRVEQGQDVMILLDSITRLGRAYNQTAETSGRTLTGGLDISALQEPKRFFGAGRNIIGKGSLTILATALIDTGSRMDDIIYEEFKGTGNMEIHLDRSLSEKRIFPAIDLNRSGTRREELLMSQKQLEGMYLIRKTLSREDKDVATEQLLD
ncbi:MAG: transcription termination factor Rho, partial [Clostridia bacterium]